jgi:endonuclease V-like protein UPF0215 family
VGGSHVRAFSNVAGFDDAPFARTDQGAVRIVGTICARTRLDGVLSGFVQRNGADATERIVELLRRSQFASHVQAVLLQGIAVAGFNVVDLDALHEALGVGVLVVMRRRPDFTKIRRALEHSPRGAEQWALMQRAGEPERAGPLWVQRRGIAAHEVAPLLTATTLHGHIPEALRLAHLIAGGVTRGVSRGRA